jgi:hypothetical protein
MVDDDTDGFVFALGNRRDSDRTCSRYRSNMLAQPVQSLTDLALGLVTLSLAVQLRRAPVSAGHWATAFWWFGAAAVAGAIHHGVVVGSDRAAEVSWALISVVVVVAVSYVLAATVADVLGAGRRRAFWLLRSGGLVAYVVAASTGHAGIQMILACESLTMLTVLALWAWAAVRKNPLARPVLVAIAASIAASGAKALSPELLEPLRLDPTSAYHLAQIGGTVLLFLAVTAPFRREPALAVS